MGYIIIYPYIYIYTPAPNKELYSTVFYLFKSLLLQHTVIYNYVQYTIICVSLTLSHVLVSLALCRQIWMGLTILQTHTSKDPWYGAKCLDTRGNFPLSLFIFYFMPLYINCVMGQGLSGPALCQCHRVTSIAPLASSPAKNQLQA